METMRKIFRSLSAFLLLFSFLPIALARNTGFNALDTGIELMSKFFYPSILLRDQTVQIGFYKFMYFIIIFAASNWALQKVFNKDGKDQNGRRAATVISFAFSAIAAYFMPVDVALASGGLITAVFNAIIPIGLTIGAVYFAFYVMKDEWWKHLIGAVIILLMITILSWVINIV